jgi:hypothetical protein
VSAEYHNDMGTDSDPLDGRECDFDWQEIFTRLDACASENGPDWPRMGYALSEVLKFAAKPVLGENAGALQLRQAGERLAALSWILEPDAFAGTPSGRELSRRLGLPVTEISAFVCEWTRRYGIRNRAQSHGRNGNHSDSPRPSSQDCKRPVSTSEMFTGKLSAKRPSRCRKSCR